VVLPVGLDHVPLLGTTLAEIATEKAGIIFPGATVILASQEPEAAEVLLRRCAEVGATVAREGLEYGVVSRTTAVGGQLLSLQGLSGRYDDVYLPLHGAHQAANAAAALAAVEAFLGGGHAGPLDLEAVRDGFARVSSPGRLEVARTSPTVLLDAAHNPAGMTATVAALADGFAFTHLVAVVSCLADKDVRAMLEVLEPAVAAVVVTQNASPRALPVDQLLEIARDVFGEDRVRAEDRLDDALDTGVALAEEEASYGGAGVLVTGSVVTVAEARTLLRVR
jgi:dihydrofolate synthase/folylpolyglutamate synthase